MKILVIATHPDIENSTVNRFWLDSLDKENDIIIRFLDDIYPKRKINAEVEKKFLEKADRVIFQFPFYWYSMPSLMRDYFDKVLEYGWAYGPNGDVLKGKEFLVALTIGAPEYSYTSGGYNNFTITELLRPLEATANAIQMTYLPHFALFNTPKLTEEELKLSFQSYIKHIRNKDLNHKKVLENLKLKSKESSFIDL